MMEENIRYSLIKTQNKITILPPSSCYDGIKHFTF